jgi:DNA polymerase-3 subunit delta
MNLTPQNLPQWLKKPLPHCFLLYGNEDYLIEESALSIRKQIQLQGDVERIELDLPTDNLQTQFQPSLFSSMRLFEVRLTKLSQAIQENLMLISGLNHPGTFILIKANGTKINPKAPWVDNLDKQGWVIAHYPLNTKQFETWLQNKAQQANLKLDQQNLRYIVETCEGNCMAASAQLDALQLAPQMVYQQQSQYTLFAIIEAALKQDTARVIKIFGTIKKTQQLELQLLLWAMAQTLRALIKITNRPLQAKQILHQERIPAYLHGLFQARAKQSRIDFRKLLIHVATADKSLKTGAEDDVWAVILDINLNLSNSALPHKLFG